MKAAAAMRIVALAVALALGGAAIVGCGDDTMSGGGDLSLPAPRDMAAPRPDCGLPCSPHD